MYGTAHETVGSFATSGNVTAAETLMQEISITALRIPLKSFFVNIVSSSFGVLILKINNIQKNIILRILFYHIKKHISTLLNYRYITNKLKFCAICKFLTLKPKSLGCKFYSATHNNPEPFSKLKEEE
jgi:hypothetical protein